MWLSVILFPIDKHQYIQCTHLPTCLSTHPMLHHTYIHTLHFNSYPMYNLINHAFTQISNLPRCKLHHLPVHWYMSIQMHFLMCVHVDVHCRPWLSLHSSSFFLYQGRGCRNILYFVRSRISLKTIICLYWTNFQDELGKPWMKVPFLIASTLSPFSWAKQAPEANLRLEPFKVAQHS